MNEANRMFRRAFDTFCRDLSNEGLDVTSPLRFDESKAARFRQRARVPQQVAAELRWLERRSNNRFSITMLQCFQSLVEGLSG